jgi:NAD(P)H-hydrate repair Nnr-like enzyme with NAD(P)H-hydrate dehydratase domain
VLTPHEGELARLLGVESSWVAAHRLEACARGDERSAASAC